MSRAIYIVSAIAWAAMLGTYAFRFTAGPGVDHFTASALANPGIGTCLRCGETWKTVKSHDTMVTDDRGMFPLCETCWAALTPEERLPYYLRLYRWWDDPRQFSEDELRAAVEAGR